MPQVTDFTALLSGASLSPRPGTAVFVTYSFPTAPPAYLSSVYTPAQLASFETFSAAYQEVARRSIDAYASVSGLTAFEVPAGQGDIQFMIFDLALFNGAAGFAYYPSSSGGDGVSSDIFISRGATQNGTNSYLLLHELGHALGLKHAFEGAITLAPSVDDAAHSILSSRYGNGFTGNLGSFDVEAVQYLYGAADRDGSQVASWSYDRAAVTLTQGGSEGADEIVGVGIRDVISGNGGDDILRGNGGDDLLSGDAGADTLYGGLGNDELSGGAGADKLFGGGGADRLYGGDGDDQLELLVEGGATGFVVDGGAGADSASVTFRGSFGRDLRLSGSAIGGIETLTINAGDGADLLTVDTALTSVTLNGGGGDDVLRGGSARGTLNGGNGDDVLYAGTGFAFLFGGDGADRFVFESVASSSGNAVDQIEDFRSGIDLIDLTGFAPVDVRIAPAGTSAYVYATGAAGQFTLFVRQAVTMSDLLYAAAITGTDGADTLTGTALVDRINGLAADDLIRGLGGRDILSGGDGADRFLGTVADHGGDSIVDLAVGDRIGISDAEYAAFAYVRIGESLGFRGVTIDAPGANLRLAIGAAADGGTDLRAVNRYSGLSDFGGDGHSDILFQNVGGAVSSWGVSGNVRADQLQKNSYFANVASSWNVVETFDMNGDGRFDILWRNTDGTVAAWQAQVGGFNQSSYLTASPGASWKIAATGDINGDGRDDMLWRNDDGSISAWRSTGAGFDQNSYFRGSVGANWRVAGLADFDGDGRDDILWREAGGAISEWLSTGSGFAENRYFDATVSSASGWKVAALADFDGDGRDDVFWRNDNGEVSVWQASAAGGFAKNTFFAKVGSEWSVAQAGDFNADGRADLLWRNVDGAISLWQSNGTAFDQNVLFDRGPAPGWTIQAHDFLI